MYNLTPMCVCAIIVAVDNNGYCTTCVCVCSLRYPACNAHAPYSHLCSSQLYYIFPHLSHKGQDFRENVFEHKMCVLISLQSLSEIFLVINRTGRDIIINAHRSSSKVLIIRVRFLIKLELSRHIFQKYSNVRDHLNSSSGSRVAFRNFANVPKNISSCFNNNMRFGFHRIVRILGYFRLYIFFLLALQPSSGL
jgi:uncharacterized membrane protein